MSMLRAGRAGDILPFNGTISNTPHWARGGAAYLFFALTFTGVDVFMVTNSKVSLRQKCKRRRKKKEESKKKKEKKRKEKEERRKKKKKGERKKK